MKYKAALKTGRVIFRRIRGRIVPIELEPEEIVGTVASGTFGGLAGGTLGVASSMSQNRADMKRLMSSMKKDKASLVESKKFVKKMGFSKVKVLTSLKDLEKIKLPATYKRALKPIIMTTAKGKNAAAAQIRGKHYLFVGKKTHKSVLGHELGHIKDYRKRGKPGFFETGLLGTLTGKTLAREKRAWKYSPVKTRKGKKGALGTYERTQTKARIGASLGVVGGTIAAILGRRAGL